MPKISLGTTMFFCVMRGTPVTYLPFEDGLLSLAYLAQRFLLPRVLLPVLPCAKRWRQCRRGRQG